MKRYMNSIGSGRRWSLFLGLVLAAPMVLAETPPTGSAERGYQVLLNTPIGAPVLSEDEYFNLWKFWPEPLHTQAKNASENERQQMALSRYGFQLSPDRTGPIPQQFTPNAERMLTVNCLACHGGPVEGTVIRGG